MTHSEMPEEVTDPKRWPAPAPRPSSEPPPPSEPPEHPALEPEDTPYPGFLQAIGLLLLTILVALILTVVIYAIRRESPMLLLEEPASMAIISTASLAIILLLAFRRTRRGFHEVFPFGGACLSSIPGVLVAMPGLLMLGLALVLSVIYALNLTPDPSDPVQELMAPETSIWFKIGFIVILMPLLEEMFFRGLILYGFLRRYRAVAAIVLSALLFAIFHMNPYQVVVPIIMGLFLGWLFLRTRALLLCFIGHAFNNALAILVSYMPEPQSPEAEAEDMSLLPFIVALVVAGVLLSGLGIWLVKRSLRRDRRD